MRRDIEKHYSRKAFVARLRRLADALEQGQPFSLMLAGRRVALPRDAVAGIEYECEGGQAELEFQLRWKPVRRKRRRA